jgi:hypothetical protein
MRYFAPLLKVEEAEDGTLKVSGVASTETPDRAGEIVKAEAIREALPDFFAHGTGALREMHGLSAAGTVDEAEIDDSNKTLITATVVDPVAIKKVQTGVYKGFSIGGRVISRDKDNRKIITQIALNEISLVDRPANPEAVLDLWKADNAIEKREFSTGERKKDAGNGAALPDGSFPIENRGDLKNAIRAIGRAKDKAKAKAHIIARARALGATDLLPDDWRGSTKKADLMPSTSLNTLSKAELEAIVAKPDPGDAGAAVAAQAAALLAKMAQAPMEGQDAPAAGASAETAATDDATDDQGQIAAADAGESIDVAGKADDVLARLKEAVESEGEDLNKGLYEVSRFAEVLQTISYLVTSGEYESEMEGDDSTVPAKLRDWLKDGAAIFKDMAKEEIDELVATVSTRKAEESAALAKADADHAAELAKVQTERDEIAKAFAAASEQLAKVGEKLGQIDALVADVAVIKKAAMPARTAGAHAVSKEQDASGSAAAAPPASAAAAPTNEDIQKALDAMPAEERALLLTKAALSMPRAVKTL